MTTSFLLQLKMQMANGLETTIDSQITSIISALNGHSNVLSNEVMNNNTQVLATYQEMQKLVPMIKG